MHQDILDERGLIVESVPLNYNKRYARKGIINELTCRYLFIKSYSLQPKVKGRIHRGFRVIWLKEISEDAEASVG